ncbi:MAG: tetratricopeptide repeat protein [Halocynthiibacter sp.]
MIRRFRIYLIFALALAPTLALVPPARAEQLSGAYLAARQASFYSDFKPAAQYYSLALTHDPANPEFLESALTAFIGLGDFESALPLAQKIRDEGIESQIANMVLITENVRNGEFDAVIEDTEGWYSVGPLVDGLVLAWARVGQGRLSEALDAFDSVAQESGTRAFGLYHKALALALVGDFEGADRILSGEEDGPLRATRNGIITHAQVLSQLERNDDAIELLDGIFGADPDPEIQTIRAALAAGETLPFSLIDSAVDGFGEVFYTVANVLNGEASTPYTLIYSRMAEFITPEHVDALLTSAGLLEELEQYDLATEAYDQVPRSDPSYHIAELGRAEALRSAGKSDAAIEVLTQLAESYGNLPVVHSALGDTLRSLERFDEASKAYDRAIALFTAPEMSQWRTYYARGITHEREGRWQQSEVDLRRALELSPGQPFVLNYLGYSLVEQQTKLDEALAMIEEAVAARPDDGYITDSLGWVQYRLGRYEEAIIQMERAAELSPVDPIISDHLGDVLWAVGRKREAEFQWRRAMSFEPEEVDARRIQRKLEVGLDAVLAEEGAEPLKVANDH